LSGEVRADLDSEVAVHALMGAFMFHRIAEGMLRSARADLKQRPQIPVNRFRRTRGLSMREERTERNSSC
jgi:hypothetical protein